VAALVSASATFLGAKSRRCRSGATRCAVGTGVGSDDYVLLVVVKPDGVKVQVEVGKRDQIRVLKAVLNTKLDVADDQQELTLPDGTKLLDDVRLDEVGLTNGSFLNLALIEQEDEVEAPVVIVDGEACLRLYVVCDVAGRRSMRIPIDAPGSDAVGDLKAKAHELICAKTDAIARTLEDYGLFIPNGPTMDDTGKLRYLRREERLKETKTLVENGLKGGEEIVFASLFFYSP